MNVFEEALLFAVKAHGGAVRKGTCTPYITHPMEAAVICSTITDDLEVLAAAVLHDTVEDTDVTIEDIESRFGERVRMLVASETENKRPDLPAGDTWRIRKEESLEDLKNSEDFGVKILWLGDKLANMRGFYRMWLEKGNDLWQRFNQKDPAQQAWYYREISSLLSELSDTVAWQEYVWLVGKVFGEVE